MIIGVLGRSRVGKDTFAKILCEEERSGARPPFGARPFEVQRLAAPIKTAVAALYGFTEAQLEGPEKELVCPRWGIRPRDAMIQVTQDTMAFMGTEFFTRRFWSKYDGRVGRDGRGRSIIIPDVRYEHDLAWIRERGGLIVKITRDGGPMHAAESHIDKIGAAGGTGMIDTVFVNNGSLGEFKTAVLDWWRSAAFRAAGIESGIGNGSHAGWSASDAAARRIV